jgi:hypothetical protein
MNFNQKQYNFIFCKESIYNLLQSLNGKRYKNEWNGRRRTTQFSLKIIEEEFRQQVLNYHPTISNDMMMFFSPKLSPEFTVGIIIGGYTWYYWFGKNNPDLEVMSFRFTTKIKDNDVIRELILIHGQKMIRIIRVMKETPKWTLCVLGEQQPFEEGKLYEKIKGKLVRDYFTMEDMIRFATNWGCPFDRDDFWDSDKPMYCFGNLENDESLADWTEYPDGFPI